LSKRVFDFSFVFLYDCSVRHRFYSVVLIIIFLSTVAFCTGCSSTLESLLARLTPSATVAIVTETPEIGETPSSELVVCAYVWSTRSLPDITTAVNQSFRTIGLGEVRVDASGYGESCLDSQTNQVVSFNVFQADFYFNVVVDDITDKQFLGDSLERIAMIMEAYPPGKVPGSHPGNYSVIFTNGSETVSLWFVRTELEKLLEENITGDELFEALNNP